jgi:PAS domain S-box-containing protein
MRALSLYDIVAHDRASIDRFVERIENEKRVWIGECKYRRKDGSLVDVEASSNLISLGGKQVMAFVMRDITERKRAEVELRRSQKEWLDIFNAISHPTFILDPQHGIRAANPAVLKQLGKPEAQVIGRKCYQLFHQTESSPLCCPMQAMLSSGKTETVEMEMCGVGGTYLVSCTPVLDAQGNLEKVIHIATDITARKRAEEALNQSHSLLQAAFDSTADGLLVVDAQGKIIQSNRKFTEMWRIPSEILEQAEDAKALEFALEQLCAPDKFIQKTQEIYAQPEVESFDLLHFKDGRTFERYSQPQRLGSQIVGRVWSFRDVTARQYAEAALREYSERLEQMVQARTRELHDAQEQLIRQERLAVLGQLAGGIAHELRSPLSAIKNAAYYFKMVVQNPSPDAREMMDILDRQVDVSARVIVNLLDFARPHAPDLRPVRLARVIEAAICECTIPQNVAVIWQADESLPNLAADLEQMQLVFRNLITNAVQAMSQGGQLTIAAQLDDDEMQITIGDTGVGIAPDALAKVFQPLFTTKAKGIGLGLALCRIIVEAHRGRIGVASQEGKGTTFTIRLPMNAEK